jgi:hypothetical protein
VAVVPLVLAAVVALVEVLLEELLPHAAIARIAPTHISTAMTRVHRRREDAVLLFLGIGLASE